MSAIINGTDDDFTFKQYSEITYSENNLDYTIVRRVIVPMLGNKKLFGD